MAFALKEMMEGKGGVRKRQSGHAKGRKGPSFIPKVRRLFLPKLRLSNGFTNNENAKFSPKPDKPLTYIPSVGFADTDIHSQVLQQLPGGISQKMDC
jgi:hypothetical protein